MAYIEAKARRNRTYYYLTHNRRVSGRWKKTRQYIGKAAPSIPVPSAKSARILDLEYNTALPKVLSLAKNPKIAACLLFGSYAKNPAAAHDIDICAIGKGLTPRERARIALRFEKPIDLSFMESMPHYIAINVFREGKALFISDKKAFQRKWMETVRTHMENQPMRERIYSGVERWMSSPTLPTG